MSVDGEPSRDLAVAPVTIVDFGDYQCSFSARVEATGAEVSKRYNGRVRVVFRDHPCEFRRSPKSAAEAAACAEDQGKYREMHDALFAGQPKLRTDGVDESLRAARRSGLNLKTFHTCLRSGVKAEETEDDVQAAIAFKATGTPAFFINGRFLGGAQSSTARVRTRTTTGR